MYRNTFVSLYRKANKPSSAGCRLSASTVSTTENPGEYSLVVSTTENLGDYSLTVSTTEGKTTGDYSQSHTGGRKEDEELLPYRPG